MKTEMKMKEKELESHINGLLEQYLSRLTEKGAIFALITEMFKETVDSKEYLNGFVLGL